MKKYTYLFAMVFILALSFICINGVQADTHTWTGSGADNQAATVANWNSMPATGDNVTIGYDARNINWNLPTTITLDNVWYNGSVAAISNMMITESVNTVITGILAIRSDHATYTIGWSTSVNKLTTGPIVLGTRALLSQTGTGGDVTCTSYLQNGAGSVLTGKVGARFTCFGNFTNTLGTLGPAYSPSLKLIMSGTGATLNIPNTENNWLQSLVVTGHTTSFGIVTIYANSVSGTYAVTGIHTISGTVMWIKDEALHTFVNTGTINGSGTFIVSTYADTGISLTGTINCAVVLQVQGDVSASRVIALDVVGSVNGLITIRSLHATRTCTVDLNGKSLSAALITASTRSIIMSSVPGASIFGAVSTINGGIINWTNIAWNPLPPVIDALSITKISGDNGIDEMMYYLAKFRGISNSTITWSLVNAPSWMHVFPNNGTIYGLTDVTSQGNNTYDLVASNAAGTTTYYGYLWVADTYYGSETMDTTLILTLIFLIFITVINIWGMMKQIGLLQLTAFFLLFAGSFASAQLWDTMPMLPISVLLVNGIIFMIGIMRGR